MTKTNQTEMDLGVKFKAPTLEQVKREASIIGMEEIEAEKFWNYHGSGGWMVGRKKMKNWRFALNYWKLNSDYRKRDKTRSIFEHRTILEAKQRIADEIKNRYCLIVAGGKQWTNQEKRAEYVRLMGEIRQINEQISKL